MMMMMMLMCWWQWLKHSPNLPGVGQGVLDPPVARSLPYEQTACRKVKLL